MQNLETKSSRPRPKSFETETRPEIFETETPKERVSRQTRLETETKSRDPITAKNISVRLTFFIILPWDRSEITWESLLRHPWAV